MKITALNFKKNFKSVNFGANKMPKNEADFLKKGLLKNPSADVFAHESTDKDAVNSALAISNFLLKHGVTARIIISGKEESLDIQDNSKNIIQSKDYTPSMGDVTYICVDFSKSERIPQNILNYIDLKSSNIYCFDHHTDTDIGQKRVIFNKSFDTNEVKATAPVYVDSSAKSATSVIYRFFEALEEKFDNLSAFEMFYGLVSDCYKKGLVEIDGSKGTIEAKKDLSEDKNAIEIFNKLKEGLTDAQIAAIARNTDIMSTLSEKEEDFYKSLFNKMQFSPDRKTAYAVLAPNDKVWEELGEDNQRTSAIINHFRQDVLKNYPGVKNAIVFYKAGENYRLSVHSKDNLTSFYKRAQKEIKGENFSIGGHESRGGGKIKSLTPEQCEEFVREIVDVISK